MGYYRDMNLTKGAYTGGHRAVISDESPIEISESQETCNSFTVTGNGHCVITNPRIMMVAPSLFCLNTELMLQCTRGGHDPTGWLNK